MIINLNVQKLNAVVGGVKQYRITFVTKVLISKEDEKAVDRWAVIEATGKIKRHLAARVLRVVGRCRIL